MKMLQSFVSLYRVIYTLLLEKWWKRSIGYEDSRVYDICYMWHGSMYKVRILKPDRKNPSTYRVLDTVMDSHGKNITSLLLPFMGPKFDFHGNLYCPSDFGYESMTFYWMDGTFHHFGAKEKIQY